MTITTTTPYKSGTLSSIGTGANGANTRLNTSGVTWAAGDVGRHVYFRNGNAEWESREIIAQSTNYCDILFAFGTYPVLLPDGVTEVPSDAPSNGNSLGVSYTLDDLDDGVTLVKDDANVFRHVTSNGWTIGADVMVHDIGKLFEFDSVWIDLDGIMQFGNLDEFGNPKNSCALRDVSTTTGGFSQTSNAVSTDDDFGAFRMFGGGFTVETVQFLRMYRDTGTAEAVQVHGVNFDGPVGGRFDGTKSYFLDDTYSSATGASGPINPKANIAMLKDIVVNSGAQAVYHFWSASESITIPGLRFNPLGITTKLVRLASVGAGYTLTFDDILIDDIQTLQDNSVIVFSQDAVPAGTNTILIKNPITVATQNENAGFRLRVKNAAGTEQYDADSDGSGNWAKASYEWGSVTITAETAYDLTDATQVGPYDISARKYDRLTQTFQFDARDPQLTTVPDVADNTIVEATEATVAAYTSLDTGDKLRDRIKVHHVDTDGFEDLSAGGGALSLAAGTDVNGVASYNLTINSAAGSTIVESAGTITINPTAVAKGSVYTKLIVPATKMLTIAGTSTFAMDLDLIGSATIPDIDRLTGTLTMTGSSILTINASGGGTLPAGTAGASAKIVVSASVTNDNFDASAFVFDASTVIENTSGNNINLALEVGQTEPTKLETSGTITFVTPTVTIDVTAPNLINDTRVLLYNSTQAAVIDNSVVAGGAGYTDTLTEGTEYDSGDTLVLLATYQVAGVAKEVFRVSATATTSDITFGDSQVNWAAHNTVGIDGSTVSECTTDYAGIEVEVNDADNSTTKSRIAAFIVDALTTSQGITDWVTLAGVPIISYKDSGNAEVNVAVATLEINNVKAAPLDIVDSFKLRASDGSSLVDNSLNTINFDNTFDAVVVETGVSGLTAAESTQLGEITSVKITTDKVDTALVLDGAVYQYTANALELAPSGGGTAPTVEEIRIEMDSNSTQLAAIVADTNELQGNQGDWLTATGFSTFNPATDTVATVTTVTNMRGTDGANTIAPDNASIASILVDTADLQANQGDWLTATGFATVNPDNASIAAILIDTADLQANQGDWLTATGFATVNPDNASIAAILIDTADLQANQGDWLTATGFSTSAEIAALNNLSSTDITSAVPTVIEIRTEMDDNSTKLTATLKAANLAAALSA